MHFQMAPGTLTALQNMDDNRAYYTFGGDLNQMGLIFRRLADAGFPVVKSNVYPGFPRDQEEEYKRALRFVYEHQVEGWWNQREKLIAYGICTQEEFTATLKSSLGR